MATDPAHRPARCPTTSPEEWIVCVSLTSYLSIPTGGVGAVAKHVLERCNTGEPLGREGLAATSAGGARTPRSGTISGEYWACQLQRVLDTSRATRADDADLEAIEQTTDWLTKNELTTGIAPSEQGSKATPGH